jgi:hypothetical protein
MRITPVEPIVGTIWLYCPRFLPFYSISEQEETEKNGGKFDELQQVLGLYRFGVAFFISREVASAITRPSLPTAQ